MKETEAQNQVRDDPRIDSPRIAAASVRLACANLLGLEAERVEYPGGGARRLCARGARWSRRLPGGERMARFFTEVGDRLRATDRAPRDASPGGAGS